MIVVVDTETTGLQKHPYARVIELAAIALHDGVEVATFSTLVYASVEDCALGKEALAVNGISAVSLEKAPHADRVLESFLPWLAMVGNPPISAFNNGFDRPMIERTMGPIGEWGPCIMESAMAIMGPAGALPVRRWRDGQEWKWPSLKEAMAFFAVEREGDAHRALSDARGAVGVWRGILSRRGGE